MKEAAAPLVIEWCNFGGCIQVLGTEWSRDQVGWYAHHFNWPGTRERHHMEPCEATCATEVIYDPT